MKVYGSTSSPYVRKVRVAAAELGLDVPLEVIATAPHDPNSDLAAKNPGIKVPALELDNGTYIYDSRIIMRYLNDLAGGSLYPAGDWAMQCRESYAEGMIDASLLVRFETALRPEELRWQGWIDGQSQKVNTVMDQMEQDVSAMTGVDAAAIAFGCALGYLDFRFADWGWRDSRPALAAWFAEFSARPSMQSAPQV